MATTYDAIQGTVNATQALPNLVTGGQPGRAQLEAFKAAGGEVVLDLRDPMEPRDFDEPATARALGLEYENVPVRPGAADDAVLERILAVLRQNAGRQVLLHCASANRVGGALIPHLMLDHGLSEDGAVQQAMRIGLRSPEFLQWGLDYAHRHAK
ncbi:MAG TPA: sulfur transferase domain-containing protein [Gemmatimonadales bacterium]|nr:sulfur transferase domain-containing protein [Gemmatimonadales bacterium]